MYHKRKLRESENLRGKGDKRLSLVLLLVVALSIVGVAYAPVTLASVHVDPEASKANPGEYFSIDVNVEDVVDLFSWGLNIEFNPNVLEAVSATEGPFMAGQPGGTSFVKKIHLTYILLGCTTLGAYPGVSGSGTLATITFHVKDAGKSVLDIDEESCKLLDSTITAIAHTVTDGYFYTDRADLLRRSAWPAHHHFDVSKHAPNQTLYAKVKNLAPLDLHVYVNFDIVRDDAYVTTVTTDETVITPDTLMELSADFGPLTDADAGKYYVSATAWYSWTGYHYTQGEKLKTFSFAVVP